MPNPASTIKKHFLIVVVLAVFALWYFSNLNGSLLADEIIYSKLATGLLHGNFLGESSVRPLMEYFFALGQLIFQNSTIAMRFFPAVFSILSLFLIYLISFELGRNRALAAISTILAGTTTLYAQYSVRGMLEIPLLFLLLSLFYILLQIKKKPSAENFFIAGIVSALAIAAKTYGVFFAIAFIAILFKKKPVEAIAEKSASAFRGMLQHALLLKKYFLLMLFPSIVFAVFLRNQLLFNWLNAYTESNRQHAIEKIPSIAVYLLQNIESVQVFLIIAIFTIIALYAFWLLLVAAFSGIFSQKPEKTSLLQYSAFSLLAIFLGLSQIFEIPLLAFLAFAFFALSQILIFFWLKKTSKINGRHFAGAYFLGAAIAGLISYLPFLAKAVDTISRFFYSNFAYLSSPLSSFVLGKWVNPSPWWAYIYWLSVYGGIVYLILLTASLLFFVYCFLKKKHEENFLDLFLFFAIPLALLSLLTMKFPRYLLSVMPFMAIFMALGFCNLAKSLTGKVFPLKNSAEIAAIFCLIAFILLPGLILPFPLENQNELLKNLPGEAKNFENGIVPHYIAEWGLANAITSPPVVSLKYPDIHIDSGMNEAAQAVKEYALKNFDKNVVVVAWNPFGSLQFYMKGIPPNLTIIDRIYLTTPEFFEKAQNGKIQMAVMLPADPEMSNFKKEIEFVEKTFKKRQKTGGYAVIYYFDNYGK